VDDGQSRPGHAISTGRCGVFGGTFDPIHFGHLIVAEAARESLELSQVLFVPAADPPHKPDAPVSGADQRLRMVDLATKHNPAFAVSRADVDRPGPHYTVDLLIALAKDRGTASGLYFIMGADSLADLLTWRSPERIIELARLGVARRPGFQPALERLEAEIPGLASRTDWIDTPLVGISASDIRRRVREGRFIKYMLPSDVESYVYSAGLYSAAEANVR
jgi:nicotinate-nucleotide adenylyltransferase